MVSSSNPESPRGSSESRDSFSDRFRIAPLRKIPEKYNTIGLRTREVSDASLEAIEGACKLKRVVPTGRSHIALCDVAITDNAKPQRSLHLRVDVQREYPHTGLALALT